MPKLKTHKGAQKRFYISGSGKILRMKGPKSHLRLQKAKRVRRQFDEKVPLHRTYVANIKRLIPNGV